MSFIKKLFKWVVSVVEQFATASERIPSILLHSIFILKSILNAVNYTKYQSVLNIQPGLVFFNVEINNCVHLISVQIILHH